MMSTPVKQIAVQVVRVEPGERSFAGCNRSLTRGILRKNLGDQIHFVAPARDRLANPFLGFARSIHLRGIDVRHSEVQPATQGRDGRSTVVVVVVPGSLTDDRNIPAGAIESA